MYFISGGFYSNQTGQLSSCKHCNNGTFVSHDDYPGKSPLDCQVCPFGTDKSVFASYRACPCLTNYTRRNRFGPCEPCPSVGVICDHEYQQVNAGFFWTWKWPNVSNWEENLHDYERFAKNIKKHDPTYTKFTFHGTLPKAYPCPLGNRSCSQVGIAPDCEKGYTGWLCTECQSSSSWKTSYFSGFQICFSCPEPWKAAVTYVCLLFMLIALFIIIWKSTRKAEHKRSILDRLLAQFKIVLAFYQVTGAMFSSMESIPWPDSLSQIGDVIEFLQFNLQRVFMKPSCYFQTLRLNAHHEFAIAYSFVGVTCLTALLWYMGRLVYIRFKFGTWLLQSTYAGDTRMRCYLFTIVVLFITYPSVCSVTLQLLPPGCEHYYLDEKNEHQIQRLRADYSIDCDTEKHRRYTYMAYAAIVYIIGFPFVLFLLLWKHRKDIYEMKKIKGCSDHRDKCVQTPDEFQNETHDDIQQDDTSCQSLSFEIIDNNNDIVEEDDQNNNIQQDHNDVYQRRDIINSASNSNEFDRLKDNNTSLNLKLSEKDGFPVWLLFLCENYKAEFWYWEIIELTRKLLQITLLTMFGSDNSWYLAVTVAVSMVYLTSHSYCKPISDGFEHALQMTSLVSIFLNLLIATSLVMSENDGLDPSNNTILAVSLVILNVGILLAVVGKFKTKYIRRIST